MFIRRIISTLAVIIISGGFAVAGWGYYFQDPFTSTGNWVPNLRYSMSEGVWAGHQNTGRTNWFTGNGKLQLTGWVDFPFASTYAADYYGIFAMFSNTMFNPSIQQPFGYEITRQYVQFDAGNAAYCAHMIDLAMVQWNTGVTNFGSEASVIGNGPTFPNWCTVSEANYPNKFAYNYYTWNEGATPSPTTIINPWTAVTNDIGYTANISNAMITNYEAATGAGQTNTVTFRVVHNGSSVSLWINPNSCQGNTNEFYFAGQYPVSFANNVVPLLGAASLSYDGNGLITAGSSNIIQFSNFRICTVVSNLVSEIAPASMMAGSSNNMYLVLSPKFSTVNEAGVGEIYVDLPNNYTTTNWTAYTNAMSVQFITTNGQIWKSFANSYGTNNPSAAGTVAISIRSNNMEMRIRFYGVTNSSGICDYFHPNNFSPATVANANTNAILIVISNFITSTSADSIGKTFTVWVNNEKYRDTTWAQTATTSEAMSYAGNAMNMMVFPGIIQNGNSLTFCTYTNQVGLASVLPGTVYEGTPTTIYLNVQASNINNSASISQVHFVVPNGFTIVPGSFASYILANQSSFQVIGTPSNTNIYINYSNEGYVLSPGSSGDTIRFNVTGTPAVPSGTNITNVLFVADCSSTLPGTVVSSTFTNSSFPSMSITVRKKPPNGQTYITPLQISNTLVSNTFQLVFQNQAPDVGNNWLRLQVWMAPGFTNVRNPVTGISAMISNIWSNNGQVGFCIDYSVSNNALTNGTSDTLNFSAMASVVPLSTNTVVSNFQINADNGNGNGWMALSAAAAPYGMQVLYFTPPAQVKGQIVYPLGEDTTPSVHDIYCDLTNSTNVEFSWQNEGEFSNNISWIAIAIPNQVTNFSFDPVSWTLKAAISTNYITNVGITNWINGVNYSNVLLICYTNSNLMASPSTPDQVSIQMMANITNSNNITFPFFAKNTTNYQLSAGWNINPNDLVITYLNAPPSAQGFVTVPGGYIDASVTTNTIYYTISNTGRPGNRIMQAEIFLPTNYIVNLTSYSSAMGGLLNWISAQGELLIDYSGTNFAGGMADTLTMTACDNVSTSAQFPVTAAVENSRASWGFTNIGISTNQTDIVSINRTRTIYSFGTAPTVLYNSSNSVILSNTNVVMFFVSNLGSGINRLTRVRLMVPPLIAGNILLVSNSFGWTNGNPAITFSNSSNMVDISYTNAGTNIPPNAGDTIQLTFFQATNLTTNIYWTVEAANNSTNDYELAFTDQNQCTNIAGWTNQLTFMQEPLIYIASPLPVYSPLPGAYYTNEFLFPNDYNGRQITRLRYGYSSSFYSSFSNINPGGGNSWTTNSTNGTNYLVVNYSPSINSITPRLVSFYGYDLVYSGNPTTLSTAEADFGDGNGWNPVAASAGQTMLISFTNPPVSGATGVMPNTVSQDFPTNLYTLQVANVGGSGNNIMWVIVVPPSFVTNILYVTNYPIQADTNFLSNGLLYLSYNSNQIQSGLSTTIQFIGADNFVTPGTNSGSWSVYVDNTPQNVNQHPASLLPGMSLVCNVGVPGYQSSVYLTATNAATNSYSVYSSGITDWIKFDVNNQSGDGSSLKALQIIPDPTLFSQVMATNSLFITNLVVTSGVTNWFSNGVIHVDYSANPLLPTEYDDILIRVNGLLTHSETNIGFGSMALFSSTYTDWKPTSLATGGKSTNLYFVMPYPAASIAVSPSQIFINRSNFNLTLCITNNGTGTADFDYARITLPNEFTNGFTANAVSATFATNKVVSVDPTSGRSVLELYYSNFPTGSNDKVVMNLSNSGLVSTNLTLGVVVRDYVYTNTNALSGPGSVFLSTIPSYYVFSNTNASESTFNTLKVHINDDANGTLPMQHVKLVFPSIFTGFSVASISSPLGLVSSNISGPLPNLVVDYSQAPIGNGDNSEFYLNLTNSTVVGNLNLGLQAWVDDGTGYYVPMVQASGYSTNIIFTMSPISAVVSLAPSQIYQNKPVFQVGYSISNTDPGTGTISQFTIYPPAVFTNGLTTNSISDSLATNISVSRNASGAMKIDLFYVGIVSNQTATAFMTLTNNSASNGVYAFNVTAVKTGSSNSGLPSGQTNLTLSTVPGIAVTPNQLDSSTATNLLTVTVNNYISGNIPIQRVMLGFSPHITNATVLSSSVVSTNFVSGTPTNLIINYISNGKTISANAGDQLNIAVADDIDVQSVNTGLQGWVDDGNGFVPMIVASGLSTNINFVMPPVRGTVTFSPSMVYVNKPVFPLTWLVSNTGSGTMYIDQVTLAIPPQLTNGFTVNSVSNTIATNTNVIVSNGQTYLILGYNCLETNQTDQIVLVFSNGALTNQTISFGAYARDYVNTGALSGATNLTLMPVPTFSVSPANLDTSTWSNQMVVTVNNNPGDVPVQETRFEFPSQFTNYVVLADRTVSSNYIDGSAASNLTVHYVSNSQHISAGDYDTLTLDLMDNYNIGNLYSGVLGWVNDGYGFVPMIPASVGATNIAFIMPQPSVNLTMTPGTVFYNLSYFPLTIQVSNTGSGTSVIDQLTLIMPAALSSGLTALSISNSLSTNITVTMSNGQAVVVLKYTNWIVPGMTDSFQLWVSNVSSGTTNYTLQALARNVVNTTNVAIPLALTNLPVFTVSPNGLDSSTYSNLINVVLNNGSPLNVKRLMLSFPAPFSNFNVVTDSTANNSAVSVTNTTNIIVDYQSVGQFVAASQPDYLTLELGNSLLYGNTNVTVKAWADAGYGFVPIPISSGNSAVISYTNPQPSVNLTMTPGTVFYNLPYFPLSIQVSNTGSGKSSIDQLTLIMPAALSSGLTASSISNSLSTNITVTMSNSQAVAVLSYTNWLAPGMADSFQLWVSNVSSGTTNYTLQALARNVVNTTNVALPLALTNLPVFTVSPNGLDTSKYSNQINVVLNNGSPLNVKRLMLSFPAPFSNFNVVTDSTANNSAVSVTNTTNIIVDYQSVGQSVAASQPDYLTLEIGNSLPYGNTNVTVKAWADAGNGFVPIPISSGNSAVISYTMPPASAVSYISPVEIPLNQTNVNLTFTMTNTGTGKSGIDQLTLDIPAMLTSGLDQTHISNSKASNIAMSAIPNGYRFTFNYFTNLPAGAVENMTINLNNPAGYSTNLAFNNTIRNFSTTNTAPGQSNLLLSQVPTYFLSITNVDTASSWNQITLYLQNNINGTNPIQKVQLMFPPWVTNVVCSGTSLLSSNFITFSTQQGMTLNYASGGSTILPGNYDVLTLTLYDNFEIGNTNGVINASCDSGTGMYPMQLASGGYSSNVNWTMPLATGWQTVLPQKVYMTTTTDSMAVTISNTSYGSSRFQYARVDVPAGFVNITSAKSIAGGIVSVDSVSNSVLINYTTNAIQPGAQDTIMFNFSNTLNFVTNVNVTAWVANTTNPVPPSYQASTGILGNYGMIQVTYPPLGAEAYFNGGNQLYLINTNGSLVYRMVNRTYGTQVTNVVLRFDTNISFTQISVTDISGKSLSLVPSATSSNTFIASFPSSQTNFGYLDNCDFQISFLYRLNHTGTVNLNSTFSVIGATNAASVPTYVDGNEVSFVSLTNSTWGALQGQVFPVMRSVNVKLFQPGTTTVATNVLGTSLAVSTDPSSGWYLVSEVPAGKYLLDFSQAAYRETNMPITVSANLVTNFAVMNLLNAPLVTGATNQEVLCYEQTNTCVILPTNSVSTSFSIDIYLSNLTAEQVADLSTNRLVKAPTQTASMQGYYLDLRDYNDRVIQGAALALDATLIFAYNKADVTARGWNESQLALFYWDDLGGAANGKWVRIGGNVDTTNGTVVAQVSYIHRIYAVMQKGTASADVLQNVVVRPKVFTPTSSVNDYFNTIRISFEMDPSRAPNGYVVKLYDVKGTLIQEYQRSGTYQQGEVYWDGKDQQGYPVKSGAYIYRIQAGSAVYSGTIIIAR